MAPVRPLPINASFADVEEYVESLLAFATSSELFQRLCGGVHILDFLTQEPDLYSTVLPLEWRAWFELHDVPTILDFLLREDIALLEELKSPRDVASDSLAEAGSQTTWRGRSAPPRSLIDYVLSIRKLALRRHIDEPDNTDFLGRAIPRHVAVGMKPKKIHEVQNFARYIDDLSAEVASSDPHRVTHIVDFGSGQNYLGRTLASPPYNKNVVALESKQHNINGAQSMDVTAKLVEKELILRNKKRYRQGQAIQEKVQIKGPEQKVTAEEVSNPITKAQRGDACVQQEAGTIQYIETRITDGDLSRVMQSITACHNQLRSEPQLMVVSLHSCGNLLHHGLRSLVVNPSVKAVAMIGCCYNLVTERLGPPTHKLSSFRISNLRLDQTSSARDPDGFPMSRRLAMYEHLHGSGIRLNITARMMACQAPQNWTREECNSFFTRHFYRALLQRILLDRGVVEKPRSGFAEVNEGSPRGWTGVGPAITVGSLRKCCYASFSAYMKGAIVRMAADPEHGEYIARRMRDLDNEEISAYQEKHGSRKKDLSILWSLMAFSAIVVESIIVVDRWLYLSEQAEVKDCWAEPIFQYAQSPRNLVVVGIKH
ncbi:MAG: hypothetical protein Q9163_001844 [Psora crenata]